MVSFFALTLRVYKQTDSNTRKYIHRKAGANEKAGYAGSNVSALYVNPFASAVFYYYDILMSTLFLCFSTKTI